MYSKTSNGDSEIVTLLAGRNKKLRWANRWKLHYWEGRLVISLTAAVRGIHSATAPVLNDTSSLHLQRYKRHGTLTALLGFNTLSCVAFPLLSACPPTRLPIKHKVLLWHFKQSPCFVCPFWMSFLTFVPECVLSSWQEQKGRKVIFVKRRSCQWSVKRVKGGKRYTHTHIYIFHLIEIDRCSSEKLCSTIKC